MVKQTVKRVLVTGSRNWEDYRAILVAVYDSKIEFGNFILVSGNCPTGADRMAEEICRSLGIEIELHPANWDKFGKRAGFIRNSKMVNSGIDFCIAFIKNDSPGATMTLELAQKKNIPVKVWRSK